MALDVRIQKSVLVDCFEVLNNTFSKYKKEANDGIEKIHDKHCLVLFKIILGINLRN